MSNEVEIVVRVKDQTKPGMSSVEENMHKAGVAGKVAGATLKAGMLVGAAGVGILGKFMYDGVKSAASYQTLQLQTAQVIKSTGNAAHLSVSGVQNLASSLETMSGVDEELIIHSENVLATFTNIKNVGKDRIFDQATKSTLDMSVALKEDMASASIQVGKALNDPVKGITALSRVGVTFTEGQKKMIAQMVKTGDTAGAQKVILRELNKEFGGAAKAAGQGAAGDLARFQDSIDDTGRAIGQVLLPVLASLAHWAGEKIPPLLALATKDFKEFFNTFKTGATLQDATGPEKAALKIRAAFDTAKKVIHDFIVVISNPVFQVFAATILSVVAAMKVYRTTVLAVTAVTEAWTAVQEALDVVLNANPIGLVVLAVIALSAALVVAYKRSAAFRDMVRETGKVAVAVFGAILDAVSAVVEWIKRHWPLLLGILTGPIGAAVIIISRHWSQIRSGVSDVLSWIRSHWGIIAAVLIGPVGMAVRWVVTHFGQIRSAASGAVAGIRRSFAGAYAAITNPVRNAVNAVRSWLSGLISYAEAIPGRIGSKIAGIIPGFAHGGIIGAASGGARSGLTMVGEHGRELVKLAPGSQVYPNGSTENMLAGSAGGGGRTVLEIRSGGSKLDDFLVEIIRRSVRSKGGDVQKVFGP